MLYVHVEVKMDKSLTVRLCIMVLVFSYVLWYLYFRMYYGTCIFVCVMGEM